MICHWRFISGEIWSRFRSDFLNRTFLNSSSVEIFKKTLWQKLLLLFSIVASRSIAQSFIIFSSPEQSRNARTREADQECLQLLVIRFHKLWNWKFTLRMNLLFQINTRQLFCPFGYSSVVSSTAWYVLLRYALCGKTVLERLQFRYFSGPSSHHQAYLAVAGDSDGLSAFKFRVGLWSLSVSCQCDLSPAWINSNSLERVWKGPSVCQLYITAHWGRAGDGTYLQLRGGLFRPPSPCHRRRTAPSRLALLSVKKARGGKISQPSASSCSLWSERSIRSCSSAIPGAFVLEKTHQLYKVKKL